MSTPTSSQPTSPLTLKRTVEIINEFCQAYPVAYAIDFRVRATQEELYGPQASPDRVGLVYGGYVPATRRDQERRSLYRGRCDIAYAALGGEEDLRKTLRHEIVGHFGLNTLTAEDKRRLLESIALSQAEDGIAQPWAEVQRNYGELPDLLIAEELFCSLTEDYTGLDQDASVAQRRASGLPTVMLTDLLSDNLIPPPSLESIRAQGPRALDLNEIKAIVAHVATGLRLDIVDQQVFPQTAREQFSRKGKTPSAEPKIPYHEVVAAELIKQIEAGTSPWQKPWSADGALIGLPMNPVTENRYRGINTVHLIAQGYADPRWMTYKQAQSIGAQVKKGEKGTSIQFWQFEDERAKTDESGQPIRNNDGQVLTERVRLERARVFYATVFNAEQIDGLPPLITKERSWNPIVRAESILAASGAQIEHKASDRAYYNLNTDAIHLPLQSQFETPGAYYATALHELGHWTGHDTRLGRDLKHPFGSEGYAREELRAEIASMLLTAELGIPHDPSQHASYVGSWVKVLQKDPLEIFRAAADAEKIHSFVMGLAPEIEVVSPALPPQQPQMTSQEQTMATHSPTTAPTPTIDRSQPIPMTLDEVRDALSFISPNMPRDDWARIGMSIKSEFPDDAGLAVFDAWSANGDGYDPRAASATWKSIKAGGGVTLGTLVKLAKENGYERRLDDAQRAQRLQALANTPRPRIDTQAEAAKTLAAQEETAATAQTLWANGQERGESDYLFRKAVGAHGVRFTDRGTVLVPLVDESGKLWNIQRIMPTPLPDGNDKLLLKNGRKSGLSHVLGSLDPSDGGENTPIQFAEGYSTAAALYQSTGWPTVMTIDSGNLPKVVAQYRQRFPNRLLLIGADNDQATLQKEGYNPGVLKAEEAAKASNALVLMPPERQGINVDFNDVWVEQLQQGRSASDHLRSMVAAQLAQHGVSNMLDEAREREQQLRLDPNATEDQIISAKEERKAREFEFMEQDFRDGRTPEQTAEISPQAGIAPPATLPKATSTVTSTPVVPMAPTSETRPEPTAAANATSGKTVSPQDQDQSLGQGQNKPADQDPVETGAGSDRPAADSPWTRLNMGPVEIQRERDRLEALAALGKTPSSEGTLPQPENTNSAQGSGPSPVEIDVDALASLRAELSKAYQFDGVGKYYFKGTSAIELAFEDRGETFNTRHHSPEVTSSIARLAKAKGWEQITIQGEPEFLREMWLQASLLGLKVKGYTPEPIDIKRLEERRALLQADANPLSPQAKPKAETSQPASVQSGAAAAQQPRDAAKTQGNEPSAIPVPAPIYLSKVAAQQLEGQIRSVLATQVGATNPQAVDKTLERLYEQVQSSRVYVGEVVKQGVAPYQFKAQERESPYVTLKTQTGEQTVWGVDLPRALEHTRQGEHIVLAYQGAKSVSVPVDDRDEQGRLTGQHWETVERNTWNAQPIKATYEQVLQDKPDLLGQPLERAAPSMARELTSDVSMVALPSAQERLRRALKRQGADDLSAEVTVSAMGALLDSPKFYVGEVMDFGQTPDSAKSPGQAASYFVRLATDEGPVTVWSDQLARAIERSETQVGQAVVLAYKGLEAAPTPDGDLQTRNTWMVEPLPQLQAQALAGERLQVGDLAPIAEPPALTAPQLHTPQAQLLYIFQSALAQAGVPQSLAMETLASAKQVLQGETQNNPNNPMAVNPFAQQPFAQPLQPAVAPPVSAPTPTPAPASPRPSM